MNSLLGKVLLRLSIYYGYTLAVAWVFTYIEHQDESVHDRKDRMLKDLRTDMQNKYNMTEYEFMNFSRRAKEVFSVGDEIDWTFPISFMFVATTLSTVGYGNITPKTRLGQLITIIVCILGIPLCMLTFKTTGELVASCLRFLVIKAEKVILKREESKHIKKKTFLATCVLMLTLLAFAATLSTFQEQWCFTEGLYAWFITFTTIGFGDYVPFQKKVHREKYWENSFIVDTIIVGLPLIFGLSIMSCLLNCVVDSLGEIRSFRNRCWEFCSRIACGRCVSYVVTPEQRNRDAGSVFENQSTRL